MEQERALNALEQFLALSKSASTPALAADLITRATSHPSTYLFAPLLSSPNIQSLCDSDTHSAHFTLLNIFSYGTYSDYISTPSLPSLTAPQTLKLRQLSLLTLARDTKCLTYATLLKELGLSTPRELEDLVITTIYTGLLTCTLDPYSQLLRISSVAPLRDLAPDTVPDLMNVLAEWSKRCGNTLAELEDQMLNIKSTALKRRKEEREWEEKMERLVEKGEKKKEGPMDEGTDGGGGYFGMGKKLGLGAGAASKRGVGMLAGDDYGEGGDGDVEMGMDDDDDGEYEEVQRTTRSSKKRGGLGGRTLGGK